MTESDLKAANCHGDSIQVNVYNIKRFCLLSSVFNVHIDRLQVNVYRPLEVTKDDDLRESHKNLSFVQIKPQSLKMKLRKNRQQVIQMNYRPAKNYPLDLYYLMDLTWTMRDDKETLVKMGGSLSQSLANLTENFRLGFGSFADKPIMPFIKPGSEENPCKLVHDKCLPTYGYKHKLGLTDDIQQFVAKVNGGEITANLDNLEGESSD